MALVDLKQFASKAFKGIESEGPFVGLPFFQLSMMGCASPVADKPDEAGPACPHCLDPEQCKMTGLSDADLPFDDLVPEIYSAVRSQFPHIYPNHITLDTGCAVTNDIYRKSEIAKKAMRNWSRLAGFLQEYAEQYMGRSIPILMELRAHSLLADESKREWRAHVRIDCPTGHEAEEAWPLLRHRLDGRDQLKFILFSVDAAQVAFSAFRNMLAGIHFGSKTSNPELRDRWPWITFIPSPKCSRAEVEQITSLAETVGLLNVGRLMVPQHFFMDRWDR